MGNLLRALFSLVFSQQILQLVRESWHFDSEFFHDSSVKVSGIYFLSSRCRLFKVLIWSLVFVKLFTNVLYSTLNLVPVLVAKKIIIHGKLLTEQPLCICRFAFPLKFWNIFAQNVAYSDFNKPHENGSRIPISMLTSVIVFLLEEQ